MQEERTPVRQKRDVILFTGSETQRPTAINLEHITSMSVEDNKLIFNFYANAITVEFLTPEAAKGAFDNLNNIWGGYDPEPQSPSDIASSMAPSNS
jgi:hypothetical protein